jgi:hypothetical protein
LAHDQQAAQTEEERLLVGGGSSAADDETRAAHGARSGSEGVAPADVRAAAAPVAQPLARGAASAANAANAATDVGSSLDPALYRAYGSGGDAAHVREVPERDEMADLLHAVSPDGPTLDELRHAIRVGKVATARETARRSSKAKKGAAGRHVTRSVFA